MFDVYEQDIKNIKLGQQLLITPNAYSNKKIKAKINFIDPNLNTSTRTIAIRATLSNAKNQLKPGMLLTSEVVIKNSTKNNNIATIFVPKTAVLWTGKRSVVYVKTNKDEPIFELREITLGDANESNYQVVLGLENGEEIVSNGVFTIDAAAQLQGKRSMMSQKMKKEKLEVKNEKVVRLEINPKFKKQLDVVFQDYINIKDAFVLTDAKKVNETAKQMAKNLKKVKMSLLKKPKAHEVWMPNAKIIKESLQSLVSESDIEKQRATFISLSNAMTKVIASFGTNKEVYVQHCPMANDNKGADWLSFDKAIKNPYFGDKMLQCGSVEQTIK
jgi:Cu(I)/Ag(I) efflux system membrane fusion protein